MKIKLDGLGLIRTGALGENYGLQLKFTLEKLGNWKKETSRSSRWTGSGFSDPTKEDYAKALEDIAKQLRELQE